jgi:hypothetical protein
LRLSWLDHPFGDEAVDNTQPIGPHLVAIEKWAVLRFGRFHQRAIGQKASGPALSGR